MTTFICPYCKTKLIPYNRVIYYCECHPLRNYHSINNRTFSWNFNVVNNRWDYIFPESENWQIAVKEPIKKEKGFVFR